MSYDLNLTIPKFLEDFWNFIFTEESPSPAKFAFS